MTLPTSPDASLLLVGKGELLFSRYRNGVQDSYFQHFGNVESLEITTNDETLQKFESMTKDANLYKSLSKRRNVQFRIVLDEFGVENMAMMLMGSRDTTSQLATAVVKESVALSVTLGGYYQLSKFGPYTVAPVLYMDDVVDVVLVEGVDYRIVNPLVGIIQILPGATAIADGDPLLASFTPTAYTAIDTVAGGTESIIELALKFIADPSAGPAWHVDVWRVSVSPDGAIGLISDEFATATLVGAVLSDAANHPDAPLYLQTQLGSN